MAKNIAHSLKVRLLNLSDRTIPNIRFWKWASNNYRQVLMVAGNHEFYNNEDIAKRGESWQLMIKPNVGYYHRIR